MKTAEIITEKGTMKVEFYEKDAPITVQNFVDLSTKGFYDGLTFHRVISSMTVAYYLWHMPVEIQGVHSFSSAIAEQILHI